MPLDFQTFVAIFAALLVFLTGVVLSYDTLELSQYRIVLPQWVGLLLAIITFFTVAVDQVLRGFVRVEEVQRRIEEEQRSVEEAERAARRARIEAGGRAGQIRYQLQPSEDHRRQLTKVVIASPARTKQSLTSQMTRDSHCVGFTFRRGH